MCTSRDLVQSLCIIPSQPVQLCAYVSNIHGECSTSLASCWNFLKHPVAFWTLMMCPHCETTQQLHLTQSQHQLFGSLVHQLTIFCASFFLFLPSTTKAPLSGAAKKPVRPTKPTLHGLGFWGGGILSRVPT